MMYTISLLATTAFDIATITNHDKLSYSRGLSMIRIALYSVCPWSALLLFGLSMIRIARYSVCPWSALFVIRFVHDPHCLLFGKFFFHITTHIIDKWYRLNWKTNTFISEILRAKGQVIIQRSYSFAGKVGKIFRYLALTYNTFYRRRLCNILNHSTVAKW